MKFSYIPLILVSVLGLSACDGGNGSNGSSGDSTGGKPDDRAPVAENASFSVNEDTVFTGRVRATDRDSDPLTFSVVSQNTRGTAVFATDGSGDFTYTPNLNANGTDTFTYVANDGNADSNTATVTITIIPVNDAPVSQNVSVSTSKDIAVNGQLSASDIDGDTLTYSITGQGALGTATITNANTGAFTYTPTPNVSGTDTFSFTASDSMLTSNTSTVTVTIHAENDLPRITSVTAVPQTIFDNSSSVLEVQATDNDGPTPLTYSWSVPTGQGGFDNPASPNPTFTPVDVSSTQVVTATVVVSDGIDSVSQTIDITVFDNNAPATIYYVDAVNGIDDNDGLTLATAFQSINKAENTVLPGDVIELRGGVHAGDTIGRPGTPTRWITLRAYNNELAIIDGTGRANTLYFFNDNFDPMYWIVDGLEIRGGDVYVVKIDTPQVKLLNNNLHSSAADIVKIVSTADDVEIRGNEIHDNNAAPGANAQGIDIVGADRTMIRNNYIHDIPSTGAYAKGNARNTIMEQNRVENIYFHGLQLGQSTGAQFLLDGTFESYDGIIRNNVIVNTRLGCLATSSSFNARIFNNSCYEAATDGQAAIYLSNESELQQPGQNIQIKNNIIFASTNTNRPVVKLAPNAITDIATLDIDRNLYWTANGANSITFTHEDLGLFNTDISTWRSQTQQDATSIVADPLYNDLSVLTISNTSPAIDAGVTVSEVTDDYAGTARPIGNAHDIGAYETILFDHTTVAGQACSSAGCHDGVSPRTYKSPTHPLTSGLCEACHFTDVWVPLIMPFPHDQTTDNCATCHTGANATNKSATHPVTTEACGACHTTSGWRSYVVPIDHTQTTDLCENCHNGTIITGKGPNHITTSLACDTCHTTDTWTPEPAP